MTPKQIGITTAMYVVRGAMEDIDEYNEQKLGVVKKRGARKELALIHNRLNKRLPEELRTQDIEA